VFLFFNKIEGKYIRGGLKLKCPLDEIFREKKSAHWKN